jgi:hypothetical protein
MSQFNRYFGKWESLVLTLHMYGVWGFIVGAGGVGLIWWLV